MTNSSAAGLQKTSVSARPSVDFSRLPPRNGPVCFCLNQISGYTASACPFSLICCRCQSFNRSILNFSNSINRSPQRHYKSTSSSDHSKKTELLAKSYSPRVTTPIGEDLWERGPDGTLIARPDRQKSKKFIFLEKAILICLISVL